MQSVNNYMEKKMQSKKALIIVPHPDDEINIAGQLILELKKKQIETFVLYTTNGDAEKKIGNKRLYEAISALEILGIKKEYVIFLGYPNEWSGKKHLYNASKNELLISKLGKSETNSIPEHPEWCFRNYSKHHLFTRNNFKKDFADVIRQISADLLVCVEFDSHPDHRATSLMFDEIIGEMLRGKCSYRPLILKKYVHEGVWYGEKDYYSIPMRPTITSGKRKYANGDHELDSPCFKWEERVAFKTDKNTKTKYLKDNIIYCAAKKHKVTTAWYEMQRVLNGDMVYWRRRTDNLLLESAISVSSGKSDCLTDFMLYGCTNVYEKTEPLMEQSRFVWTPYKDDADKIIKIIFEERKCVKLLVIYEDCNAQNHIKRLIITADGNTVYDGEVNNDGTGTVIKINGDRKIESIEIKVVDYCGTPGISEIEAYSHEIDINDFVEFGLEKYSESQNVKYKKTLGQNLEKLWFTIVFALKFKIKYELKKRLDLLGGK